MTRKKIGALKTKFWQIFTRYIKLKYSEDGKYVSCFTCAKPLEIGTTNCQGGHWLPKKGYPFHYFTEDNVRPQCYHCNHSLEGNTAVFENHLRKEIGNKRVDDIYNSRHDFEKKDWIYYTEKIKEYTLKLKEYES